MCGAIRLNRPAAKEQAEHDTQNQLLLFRQTMHGGNVAGRRPHRNSAYSRRESAANDCTEAFSGRLPSTKSLRALQAFGNRLVSFISTNMMLVTRDVILAGTSNGVGPIQSGDRLEVRIQGLAPLINSVK